MKCKLCGSEQMPVPKFKGIVECVNCGLLYFPENLDTKPLYGAEYFHGDEYLDYKAEKQILQKNFRGRVDYLNAIRPNGQLFEIGCAYGFFLDLARHSYEVSGVDISEDAVASAKKELGLKVESGDFLQLKDNPGNFDFICMWDTIEHLAEPFNYLKKAAQWLKPGGHLLLTTGDIGSFLAKMRGENWRQIHPPTHLFYFSKPTMVKALQLAGLELVEYKWIGQYRSYRAMVYGIFKLRHPGLEWIYNLLTIGGRLDFPIYLNTFDLMQVTAKKP